MLAAELEKLQIEEGMVSLKVSPPVKINNLSLNYFFYNKIANVINN